MSRKKLLKNKARQMAFRRAGILTLTIRNVCELLDVSEGSVRRYIDADRLQACKEGPENSRKRVFIYLSSFLTYVDSFTDI